MGRGPLASLGLRLVIRAVGVTVSAPSSQDGPTRREVGSSPSGRVAEGPHGAPVAVALSSRISDRSLLQLSESFQEEPLSESELLLSR